MSNLKLMVLENIKELGEEVNSDLQELEHLGVNHIITFDAHDPNLPFENFYLTNTILEDLLKTEDLKDTLVISPIWERWNEQDIMQNF